MRGRTRQFSRRNETPAFSLSSEPDIDCIPVEPRNEAIRHGEPEGAPDLVALGGTFAFERVNAPLLLALLPGLIHIPASEGRTTRLGRLIDDPDRWPHTLLLDGLTYTALEPNLPAGGRLEWLCRDPGGFQPGPYEQLAAHYTATGRPDQARRVLLAKERRHRSTMAPIGRIWSLLQDITVAYGYQPWRAALWLLALLAGGSLLYHRYPPPALSPGGAPHFNAVVYTLDLLLPLVDLGQKHAFNPAGVMQWFSYVLVAAGWVLATTIAAGVARVIRRG